MRLPRDGVEQIAARELQCWHDWARITSVAAPNGGVNITNNTRNVACTGGFGTSRRMTFVMIASVRSTKSRCVRS